MKLIFKTLTAIAPALIPVATLFAQNLNRQEFPAMENTAARRMITVPAIDGLQAVKCDFHLHTVFSDGEVWPVTRVEEAWTDGLDAIAITDHDRYKPHRDYLKADNATPFEIAKETAAERGILLIPGLEITRKMPPGHFNSLFLTDGNLPELEDTARSAFLVAVEKLAAQGALLVWNHPGWAAQQKDTVKWFEIHQALLEKGWLHGIEVFNYAEWYPIALQWAVDKNLSPLANSDMHAAIRAGYGMDRDFVRPMTLVFARDKSAGAVREAMLARRTVAWFNGMLAGSGAILAKLFSETVQVSKTGTVKGKAVWSLANATDLPVELEGISDAWRGKLTIPARSAVTLKTPETTSSVRVKVTNWRTGMRDCLEAELRPAD